MPAKKAKARVKKPAKKAVKKPEVPKPEAGSEEKPVGEEMPT
jgi:hypothetical protein